MKKLIKNLFYLKIQNNLDISILHIKNKTKDNKFTFNLCFYEKSIVIITYLYK